MDITDYMHPLFKHGKTKDKNSIMNATINALNSPLQDSEQRILKSRTNVLLSNAPKEWLDYFGSYLGLHRKDNENDTDYRQRLINWVLVDKNDVSSIRNAIADFLQINADRIFIYEPYNDIFYYNYNKSLFNSFSFRPSTYYNYAIIDVKIDSAFPYKEIADIINLFRPSGVIWVVTSTINSYNPNAPIIDNSLDIVDNPQYHDTENVGFNTHDTIIITPEINDGILVTNPFYWNVSNSLWNGGKEYGNSHTLFQDYLVVGEYDTDFNITKNSVFSDVRKRVRNYDMVSNHLMSVNDNQSVTCGLNDYELGNETYVAMDILADSNNVLQQDNSIKVSKTYSHTFDNAEYVTLSILALDDTIVTINNNQYKVTTTFKPLTIALNNHVLNIATNTPVFFKDVFSYSNIPSTSDNNSFYPYNAITGKIKGIGGILDTKHMLVSFSNRYNTQTPLADILNSYSSRYLSLVLSTSGFNAKGSFVLELFDINSSLWVQYKEFSLSDKSIQINLAIPDFTNYINDNGLFAFRVRPLNDSSVNININYVGFSLRDIIYNEPPISWYFNTYQLVDRTNFEDNQIGNWNATTVNKNAELIGNTYQCYISGSNLVDNYDINVVPMTTYYVDIWYNAQADTQLKLGDTALLTLPKTTDWEHIVKDVTIPDRCLHGNINLSSSSNIDLAYISLTIEQGSED